MENTRTQECKKNLAVWCPSKEEAGGFVASFLHGSCLMPHGQIVHGAWDDPCSGVSPAKGWKGRTFSPHEAGGLYHEPSTNIEESNNVLTDFYMMHPEKNLELRKVLWSTNSECNPLHFGWAVIVGGACWAHPFPY